MLCRETATARYGSCHFTFGHFQDPEAHISTGFIAHNVPTILTFKEIQNMIISSLLFILAVIGLGFLISEYCGIKDKYTPLISVTTFMCIGIIAGVLNILTIGCLMMYVMTFCGGGIALIRKKREFYRYVSQLPIICFIIGWLFLIILFSIKPPFFASWDEFSHWGPFLKNLKYTDQLHIYSETFFTHQTYVQGIPVFYYLTSFFDNCYREESVCLAYSMLLYACAATIVPNIPVNKKWRTSFVYIILVSFFWYMFPYASYAAPYTSSYLDSVLGALFGATMMFIIDNLHEDIWRKKSIWCFSVSFFALLQIKDISIAFYLICLATCTINLLYLMQLNKKTECKKKRIQILSRHHLYQEKLYGTLY